jgi:hypothetical protein
VLIFYLNVDVLLASILMCRSDGEKWRFGKAWKTAKNYLKLHSSRKSNLELSKTLKVANMADRLMDFPVMLSCILDYSVTLCRKSFAQFTGV